MIFNEPDRTPYDVRFSLFGVPVRIHPFFWLGVLLMNLSLPPAAMVIWTAAVIVSLIVHEFGHVFAMRYYGQRSHVVLLAFGGLAIPDVPARRSAEAQVIISLAGPFAGFAFFGLLAGVAYVTGHLLVFRTSTGMPVFLTDYFSVRAPLDELMRDLLEVNLYWGLINLIPVLPLDGGQMMRAVLTQMRADGLRESFMVSTVVAGMVAVFFWMFMHQQYLAMLFAYLAYQSYQTYQSLSGGFGGYR